jgi:surface polysaccharide O-acyltransferase-like enzyme
MRQHIKSIDYLRVISILAVVLIHTTTRTLETVGYDLNGFPMTLFLNQIARFAVPLFILISGFVLEISYNPKENYFSFIKRRFSKIFIPYIFWSAIYYFFVYNQNHDNFLKVILTGNASYQLYFIPTLCIFYLLFPFLYKIYNLISKWWSLTILGISQILLMRYDYFVKQFSVSDPLRVLILSYFLFIIGIVAARNKEKIFEIIRKIKYAFIVLIPSLAFYLFEEGRSRYFLTYDIKAFYSQWRPSVFVYTVLVSLILFYIFEKSKFQSMLMEKLSKLSFLVFFIHVIVLENLWAIFGKNLFNIFSKSLGGRIFFDPIFFGMVAITSFFIAFILHKIPKLWRVTG